MAEGGQFPWKRQTIDVSRGPVADYSVLKQPLPSPPKGVEWKYEESKREWRLVRADNEDKDKRKYSLHVATTWNPHCGRAQPTIVPVLKEETSSKEQQEVANITSKNTESEKPKEPVQGEDYCVHTVLSTDTIQGLCLRYKIKPTTLRQVNKFSGSNLLLAPSRLIIPLNSGNIGRITVQDTSTPQYKLHSLRAEYPHLTLTEAAAYLELNDWNVEEAIQSVKEDEAWEVEEHEKEVKNKHKPTVLNVHMAVPAVDETMRVIAHKDIVTKEDENRGLMEPLLLKEVELSSRVLC